MASPAHPPQQPPQHEHAGDSPAAQPCNDSWRRWIAENLMQGGAPAELERIMGAAGVAGAREEIDAALRSPYLHGARRLQNRLAKRDWVLAIPAKLSRLAPAVIARRHRLSTDEFLQQHYLANKPVIITGMLDDCAARQRWSLDYFQRQLGPVMVEVQFDRDGDPRYEQNSLSHKRTLRFGDYVELVRNSGGGNNFYITANNNAINQAALRPLWPDMPALPEYLAPSPQGGFFWFGPAGTVTPFHHDLTNNFMAQIMGRKRVRLVAPWEVAQVYNQRHCFSEVDGRAIDLRRFPAMAGVPVIDCVLEPGEILFLPVGWWHFVEALDISVTVSSTHFRWPNDYHSNYPADHDF